MAHPALSRSVITPALVERFSSAGHWRWRGWVAQLLTHVRERPEAIALIESGHPLSFRQLAARASRVAAEFRRLGIGKGDIVGVQLANVAEFHVVRYALAALGAVLLPIGIVYRERELLHALGVTEACTLVVPGDTPKFDHAELALRLQATLPALRHIVVARGAPKAGTHSLDAWMADADDAPPQLDAAAAGPNDVDMLLMSSGTTGLPKVIMVTPNAWLHAGAVTARLLQTGTSDVVLSLPPLTGGAGYNNGLGSPAVSGATVVLQPTFGAEGAIELLETYGATVVAAVPAQAIKILEVLEARQKSGAAPARTKVRAWISVGAHLPAHTAERLEEVVGCRVVNIYGAVEAASIAGNRLDDSRHSRHHSIGRLIEGTEVRMVGEDGQDMPAGQAGDLLTRQPAMAAGYFGDDAATRAVFDDEGWVRTGDHALVDPEGLLRIEGRKKDVINRGGMKISAAEIEDLLRGHPAIVDVAVVGMPDAVFGEKACAYVVKRPETTLSLAEVVHFLRAREFAAFKLPERLEVVDEFPYSSGFKVQKSALREDIARKLRSEQA